MPDMNALLLLDSVTGLKEVIRCLLSDGSVMHSLCNKMFNPDDFSKTLFHCQKIKFTSL